MVVQSVLFHLALVYLVLSFLLLLSQQGDSRDERVISALALSNSFTHPLFF
jgi:hypothetical protein